MDFSWQLRSGACGKLALWSLCGGCSGSDSQLFLSAVGAISLDESSSVTCGYYSKMCDCRHTPTCFAALTEEPAFRIINSERKNPSDLARLSETAAFSSEKPVLPGRFWRNDAVPGNRGKDRRVQGRDSEDPATAGLGRLCYFPARLPRWLSPGKRP